MTTKPGRSAAGNEPTCYWHENLLAIIRRRPRPMKRLLSPIRFGLTFALVAAASIALTGCRRSSGPEVSAPLLPAVSVSVQTVVAKSRPATEDVVGTVRPKLSARLEAKVSGRVEEMLVAPGQTVTNGQLLLRLAAPEISSRLDQANAALEQADRDWQRVSALFGQQTSSRSEYDAADARYRVAKAAAAEAKAMMSYCEVTAPFAGIITRKLADVGDLAMPGKTLLELENPTVLRLEADVPEALMDNLKMGDQLAVRVPSVAADLAGTVVELSPAADPNSRTFLVKLDLLPTAALRSGQFGHVVVPVGEVNSIRVPARALLVRGQMEIVFVAVHGQAQLRLVKTGNRLADEVEIVSGLAAGESVVTEGVDRLVDGQPILVQPTR